MIYSINNSEKLNNMTEDNIYEEDIKNDDITD